ncbi:MAG: Flp pilus assembly protein TadG [Actinomycetia bacterium]|nr:Flp pilus assembly protein TadG [Actinomycetes bacterium]
MFLDRRPRGDDERGWVLVWFAIMLVVLLSMAAFAVDTSLWTYDQTKQQRAADAAALAGAVYLPGNVAKATEVATTVATLNGYTTSTSGRITTVDVNQVAGQPNQLQVTITDNEDNLFGALMGTPTSTIRKTGVATYDPPIAMGSPVNQIGNDPDITPVVTGSDRYPNLWVNVAGSDSPKANGDAYLAGSCSTSADNCSGSNSDLSSNGYYYTVHAANSGPLTLQGFDPGFVAVGDNCTYANGNNADGSNLSAAKNLPANFNPKLPMTTADIQARYAPVGDPSNPADPGQRYCTGDHNFASGQGPTTTYKVFGPATIAGEPSSAPATPVCTMSFPGFTGDLAPAAPGKSAPTGGLYATTALAGAPDPLVKYFRQWYTLCTINATAGSDYFLQITTGNGSGHNRLALRGFYGSVSNYPGTYAANSVNIYASTRMSIYANVASADTTTKFHLARLLPGSPGRTLVLDFFDIGDSPNNAVGSLQIVPPADSGLATFGAAGTPCTATPPPGTSTGPPWGTPSALTNCTITGVTTSTYGGQWIEVRVPIPDTYSCTVGSPTGCWVQIAYKFDKAINDTTSWTAHIDGDPVRIVK